MRHGNAAKTHCPQGHPYSESNTYTSKDGRACRTCKLARQAARQRLPEVRARRAALRRSDNAKATHRRWTLQTWYGVTPERYDELFAEQGGVCAICKRPPTTKRLGVDHDHTLGSVRGLLCDDCNRALGGFKDDPAVVEAAARYLRVYWPEEAFAA